MQDFSSLLNWHFLKIIIQVQIQKAELHGIVSLAIFLLSTAEFPENSGQPMSSLGVASSG